MRLSFYQTIGWLLLLGLIACKKDKPNAPEPVLPESPHGVLVACEGSLGFGNASLTFFREGTEPIPDVYKNANGNTIGDVLQSITRMGNRLFLCVNNSDKVLVIGAEDFKLQASLPVPKPRYILPISDTRAYVSTLFSNRIFEINPATATITDTIVLPVQNPEGMLLRGDEVFVCGWDTASQFLYVLNTHTNTVSRTIALAGKAPQAVVCDGEGMLWVLSGNNASGIPATWSRINPVSGELLAAYYFPETADPIRPAMNPAGDTLYWISVNQYGGVSNNGIYRMPVHAGSLPETPFIQAVAWQYFWALAIDPATGYIYTGDPKGFTQKGSVQVYRQDGTLQSSFETGVGPGHIYFQ